MPDGMSDANLSLELKQSSEYSWPWDLEFYCIWCLLLKCYVLTIQCI